MQKTADAYGILFLQAYKRARGAVLKKRLFKWLKIILIASAVFVVVGIVTVLCLNAYVKNKSQEFIISPDEALQLENNDCILVLGCLVRQDGSPSLMLGDRLETGMELYEKGVAPKLLMSGDHGQKGYNEVGAMKDWAIDRGAESEDVFMDHAGFSTYESMYRAKEIFGVKKAVIVSQEYHLYRAVYIARALGIEAYGVPAGNRIYSGQTYRNVREGMARAKDFMMTVFKPEPTYLGDTIAVSGNGDITND